MSRNGKAPPGEVPFKVTSREHLGPHVWQMARRLDVLGAHPREDRPGRRTDGQIGRGDVDPNNRFMKRDGIPDGLEQATAWRTGLPPAQATAAK